MYWRKALKKISPTFWRLRVSSLSTASINKNAFKERQNTFSITVHIFCSGRVFTEHAQELQMECPECLSGNTFTRYWFTRHKWSILVQLWICLNQYVWMRMLMKVLSSHLYFEKDPQDSAEMLAIQKHWD